MTRLPQQHLAFGSDADAAGSALEEGDTEPSLKLANLLAEPGLTDAAVFRGAAEVPELCDGDGEFEVTKR